MLLKRLKLLLLTTLVLTGCSPRLAQMQELPVPPQRIVQKGYSFMPFNEKGWRILGRNSMHIILGRYGPSLDETSMILAGNVLAPHMDSEQQFKQFVRSQTTEDDPSGLADRFTDQATKMVSIRHAGADCERVHQTTVDHMAETLSGNPGVMTLEVTQLFCRQPDKTNVVTYISYSQRYDAGSRDPKFDAKAQRLLGSLEFSKF